MLFENENEEKFPSEDFGKATGMEWIYTEWKIPDDGSIDEFGKKINKLYDELDNKRTAASAAAGMLDMYNMFLRINPDMTNFGKPTSWLNIYDFINGVISKFNVDDIKYYANMDWPDRAKYNLYNRPIIDQIEKKAGHSTEWVMSPTTIKRVKKELGISHRT